MEIEIANTFNEFITHMGKHMDIKLSDCGLFFDETLPCRCKPRQNFAMFKLRKGFCGNQIPLFNKPYKIMLF